MKKDSPIDFKNIMDNFRNWYEKGDYSSKEFAYGIGRTTRQSIINFIKNEDIETCGLTSKENNGNGALMDTDNYLDLLRSSICYGWDTDTICAIAGAVGGQLYEVSEELKLKIIHNK